MSTDNVLWGWKAGVVTEPIRLADGTQANKDHYEAGGWTTAIYAKKAAPLDFRIKVAGWMKDLNGGDKPAEPVTWDETQDIPTEHVKSSELRIGDIVREHGMRVHIDTVKKVDDPGGYGPICCCSSTVLNLAEVHAARFIPPSFLRTWRYEDGQGWVIDREDQWTVQGNDLASWCREVRD